MTDKRDKTPANQGRGGKIPPIHARFQPGQSGNPKGRPPAGLSVIEHINGLTHAGVTRADLLKILRNPKEPVARVMAAKRLLNAIEHPDLAEFESVIRGEKTLTDLRDEGVDTSLVKKLKARVIASEPDGEGVIMQREIELHDRSGDDFDRILDRTIGKPIQEQKITHEGAIRTTAEGEDKADSVLSKLNKILGNTA